MIRALDIERDVKAVVIKYKLTHLANVEIAVVYNESTRSKAIARIWGLHKVFQIVYGTKPLYVIELLPRFSKLTCGEKLKIIAHELAHIPKTASGSLRPHNRAFWRDYRILYKLFRCEDFTSLLGI
ncbi:MAG: putative metallopeptidase [Pyrobaculum sp.]|jgi:predicted metallopeptidase